MIKTYLSIYSLPEFQLYVKNKFMCQKQTETYSLIDGKIN